MKVNDYVKTKYGISKIISNPNTNKFNIDIFKKDGITLRCIRQKDIIKSSPKIIDLVEYMDLIWVKNPIKLYGKGIEVSLFNPVRCDGFTTFEDGTHCIILNLDYIIDIKDLKIKGIITHEQIESMEYKVKE